jgi:hypothetical protein
MDRGTAKPMERSMSPEQARRPVKATVLGLALVLPLLAGCAYDDGYYGDGYYDDGYYGPPADYGYGYGYYGYGYGHPCGWRYDCDDWGHRRHHHRHYDDDVDDGGQHHGGGDDAHNPPPAVNPGLDRQSSPAQIWLPNRRDSRR